MALGPSCQSQNCLGGQNKCRAVPRQVTAGDNQRLLHCCSLPSHQPQPPDLGPFLSGHWAPEPSAAAVAHDTIRVPRSRAPSRGLSVPQARTIVLTRGTLAPWAVGRHRAGFPLRRRREVVPPPPSLGGGPGSCPPPEGLWGRGLGGWRAARRTADPTRPCPHHRGSTWVHRAPSKPALAVRRRPSSGASQPRRSAGAPGGRLFKGLL